MNMTITGIASLETRLTTAQKIVTLRADLALLVNPAEQPHLWGIIDVMLCGHLDSRQQQGLLNDLQGRGLINADGSIK